VRLQQLASFREALAHHVSPLQHEQVEDEEVERRAGGAMVLEQVE